MRCTSRSFFEQSQRAKAANGLLWPWTWIAPSEIGPQVPEQNIEPPLSVKEAAKFLGVSPQTVYLWVERKQIPHLRVMGRNIRFLKSDLEPFRASFRQEMVNV
ncbi:MAG: helix-turn-helix domain-containing protein [Terriglobales bacterium]|jgi:excisionase family DNA binding protein